MASFELDISFLPRYDQGSRGTCMAFAVTSLLEYYFHCHGNDVHLSPQYLYARCKCKEQSDEKGTTLATAFEVVKAHGVCKETDWPYNRHGKSADSDQTDWPCKQHDSTIAIEPKAVENEMQIKTKRLKELDRLANVTLWEIREQFHEFYTTPCSAEECKAALRGDGGFRPMPVVVGCMVFPSFMEKTNPNGWVHLPIPGEKYQDGHAMLLTGYHDTPGLRYEGFFWALNSWGPSIHDDPQHEGMVKIPYEYFHEGHVLEAGTIREIMPPEEAERQKHGQMPWQTEEQTAMTEPPANVQSGKHVSATSNVALADAFFSSLEDNLKLKKPAFPLPYELFHEHKPLLHSKNVQLGKTQDESSRFMGFIHENTTTPRVPRGVVNVIPLCKNGTFRLITAALSHDDGSEITVADIAVLRDFISRRLKASRTASLDMLVVAATAFDDACKPVLSPPIVLCTPANCNRWDFRFPLAVFSTETIQFLLHALPGSPDAYADRLADLIKYWPKTMYCTKDALRPKLALHPSIPDAFFVHWLNVLFERAARSKDKNDWYAKDDRGVIYPPGAELPEGHGAKRVERFA